MGAGRQPEAGAGERRDFFSRARVSGDHSKRPSGAPAVRRIPASLVKMRPAFSRAPLGLFERSPRKCRGSRKRGSLLAAYLAAAPISYRNRNLHPTCAMRRRGRARGTRRARRNAGRIPTRLAGMRLPAGARLVPLARPLRYHRSPGVELPSEESRAFPAPTARASGRKDSRARGVLLGGGRSVRVPRFKERVWEERAFAPATSFS